MRTAILGIVLALGACSSRGEEREAARATAQRSFQVGEFRTVSLEGSHDVVVALGAAPSVRAEGEADDLERLDIRVENGTLKIGTRGERRWFDFGHHHRVTVYVTAPALNGARIEGSGDMRVDRAQAEAFEAVIEGSGDLEIGRLQARRANFSVAGSGDIRAAGTAEQSEISVAGSGSVDLAQLQTRRSSVSVAGSGDISVRASEAVQGELMGSGDITVHGTARCSVSKMGSGDVRCGA